MVDGHRSALAVLALLAGVGGCFESVAPLAGRGRLAFYPVFAETGAVAGRDATPTDVDSFVIVVLNPPSTRPDTIVRRLEPGQDTLRFEIDVAINEPNDSVVVQFRGYNSLTGMELYRGSQTLPVSASFTYPARALPVSYTGPGQNVVAVVVSPDAASLAPGGSVQLLYDGFDAGGLPLPDDSVPVRYSTSNRSVATVSSAGLVVAQSEGTALVFVTALASRTIEDTAVITVSTAPPPAIGIAPASVLFRDTAGTSDPAPATVNVTNTGGGSLTGLALGAIQYGAGGSGWLTAALNQSAAPATLTLTAAKGALAAGTYTASVPVLSSSAANSPQTLNVSFEITAAISVATLQIAPGYLISRPGDVTVLAVTARDGSGATVPTAGTTFTSRNGTVASVNAAGQVTAIGGGQTVVVAELAGVRDSIMVGVAANGSAVARAIADLRSFGRFAPGDTVRLLVGVDLRGVSPELLGSYNAQLDWAVAALAFERTETVAGGFTAPTVNATETSTGRLRFGAADPAGHAGPDVVLLRVVFVAVAAGSSTSLSLSLTDLSAAVSFTNLLPQVLVLSGHLRVQ
jgi:hypothetical protein